MKLNKPDESDELTSLRGDLLLYAVVCECTHTLSGTFSEYIPAFREDLLFRVHAFAFQFYIAARVMRFPAELLNGLSRCFRTDLRGSFSEGDVAKVFEYLRILGTRFLRFEEEAERAPEGSLLHNRVYLFSRFWGDQFEVDGFALRTAIFPSFIQLFVSSAAPVMKFIEAGGAHV